MLIVRDASGQALACVYFEDEFVRRRDEIVIQLIKEKSGGGLFIPIECFQQRCWAEPGICHLNEDGPLPLRARCARPVHAFGCIFSIVFHRYNPIYASRPACKNTAT